MTTVLTWEPRRLRLYTARSVSATVLAFAISTALQVAFLGSLVPAVVLHGTGEGADGPFWWALLAAIARTSLLTAVAALLAVALATVARCSHWAHSPSIARSSWSPGLCRSRIATSARRPESPHRVRIGSGDHRREATPTRMVIDLEFADIDFMDSPSWDESMHDRLRWLRENDPVSWSPATNAFIITKFDDVSAISRNQAVFTSGRGVRRSTSGVRIGLIDEPEPRHGELRRLIGRGFTPRMVAKLEEVFQALTSQYVDAVLDKDHFDFVREISVPLPLLMIAEMIGIRPDDRERFHQWSDALIAADGNYDRPEIMEKSIIAFGEYSAYVTEIIAARRANPQDDLVSILVGAKDAGLLFEDEQGRDDGPAGDALDEMPTDELIMFLVLLLVAGNETTRNGISGGMQLLVENPEQCRRLIDDPELIPSAVEEMLRLVSPVHSFTRTVTQDTEVRGVKMREGDDVVILYPSANRDGDRYEAPDEFRVDRNPQHLAFGIGPHFCLGASLARMEMRVVFATLLGRMSDLAYAESGRGALIVPSALVRNCTEMQITFTPR